MARINNTNIEKTSLVAFRDGAFELDVAVSATDNTVWLTLDQVSLLFEKDKSTVSRHIKNIFSELFDVSPKPHPKLKPIKSFPIYELILNQYQVFLYVQPPLPQSNTPRPFSLNL